LTHGSNKEKQEAAAPVTMLARPGTKLQKFIKANTQYREIVV